MYVWTIVYEDFSTNSIVFKSKDEAVHDLKSDLLVDFAPRFVIAPEQVEMLVQTEGKLDVIKDGSSIAAFTFQEV